MLTSILLGVVATLTDVVNVLRGEVEELANLDGIINLVERRLIVALRMVNFPLFVMELVSFLMIFGKLIQHSNDIEFVRAKGDPDPHYCERGIWNLMIAVAVIYPLLLLFRVAILVGSLLDGKKKPITVKEQDADS